jgi:hypothetical protein
MRQPSGSTEVTRQLLTGASHCLSVPTSDHWMLDIFLERCEHIKM